MELINEELTASNASSLGKALSQGHIFRNSTPNNGTHMREHITWMTEYQRHANVATMMKLRQFYKSWDVQAGMGSITNSMKYLNEK